MGKTQDRYTPCNKLVCLNVVKEQSASSATDCAVTATWLQLTAGLPKMLMVRYVWFTDAVPRLILNADIAAAKQQLNACCLSCMRQKIQCRCVVEGCWGICPCLVMSATVRTHCHRRHESADAELGGCWGMCPCLERLRQCQRNATDDTSI